MIKDKAWQQMAVSETLNNIPVRLYPETTSTNEIALKLALAGAPAYTTVVAEGQTAGRGRLGKEWVSPAGTGLYMSIILRPELELEDLPKITLAAGLAVCLALEKITDLAFQIKWPNDILLSGKKLGGILAETADIRGKRASVVLGIGLNINSPLTAFPTDLQDRATSLLIHTGNEYRRSDLMSAIVNELQLVVARFERDGFDNILQEWRQKDATIGLELDWVANNGEVIRGFSLGPDENGQLLIRDRFDRTHEVLSGDINLARRRNQPR